MEVGNLTECTQEYAVKTTPYHETQSILICRIPAQVLDYNMALTGNGAEVAIYTDGEESNDDRRGVSTPSVVGNQLSGTFKLTLRGWETEVK